MVTPQMYAQETVPPLVKSEDPGLLYDYYNFPPEVHPSFGTLVTGYAEVELELELYL